LFDYKYIILLNYITQCLLQFVTFINTQAGPSLGLTKLKNL